MTVITSHLLQTPAEYQAERSAVFPSVASLEWFVRQHRNELADAGAIVAPTGRRLVVVDVFDQAVLQIGARRERRGA